MVVVIFRAAFLLLPSCLLLLGVMRTTGAPQRMLLLGSVVQLIICSLTFLLGGSWRQPVGPSVITVYLIALGWLWFGIPGIDDWYPHFAQAVLLIVPLAVFSVQTLTNSGAPALRRGLSLPYTAGSWEPGLRGCR